METIIGKYLFTLSETFQNTIKLKEILSPNKPLYGTIVVNNDDCIEVYINTKRNVGKIVINIDRLYNENGEFDNLRLSTFFKVKKPVTKDYLLEEILSEKNRNYAIDMSLQSLNSSFTLYNKSFGSKLISFTFNRAMKKLAKIYTNSSLEDLFYDI